MPSQVRAITAVLLLTAGIVCVPGRAAAQGTQAPAPASASAVKVETVARGLEHPWGLQVLPEGDLIVTERPGRIRLVSTDGRLSPPLAGAPKVAATGQGGMLDIALAPDFATSREIYVCYAEPRDGRTNGSTVARARLVREGASARLDGLTPIFRQEPATGGGLHFGCRMAFAGDGRLLVALGERYQMETAQDLGNHRGKVVRLERDGRVPPGNPFVGQARARPEVWSYGHRNPQAAAIHPETGRLWVVEHGPRGGDEVNVVLAGRNYGWPIVGYGIDYSGARLHKDTHQEGMEPPIYYWRPSIAPSGMAFYTADAIPGWKGNLLVGALAGKALHRLVLDGEKITQEEVLLKDVGERIRDVRQAPDGTVLLLTDSADGRVLRLVAGGR
jgi:glucose/arabinose dehydrogenase